MDKQRISKSTSKRVKLPILSFGATWSAPAKKQLDNLIDLQEEWNTKYKANIIAVSIDDARTTSKVQGMVNAKGWEYTILCDPNQKCYQTLNFQSAPQTYLIDKHGKIAFSHTGYKEGDQFDLEKQIEELSKEQ